MEALDRVFDFKLNSSNKDYIQDILEEYKIYLKKLRDFSRSELFLDTLRRDEVIHNQEMESEEALMIKMGLLDYEDHRKKTSIDVLASWAKNGKVITPKDIEKVHRLLIHGTRDDVERNYPYRDFDTYVHEMVNGAYRIQYDAVAPEKIGGYMKSILAFSNDVQNVTEQDIFYKSILEHFYIAALQPFGNGNTRLARIMEYNEIFKLTRHTLDETLDMPALFMSKNYMLSRASYREWIARLVQDPTDEAFNKWYMYNLNAINDQLFFCNNQLKFVRR